MNSEMPDRLTPPTEIVRRQMQRQRTSGTTAELAVRRALHRLGYRYRVDYQVLPDQRYRGDIVWRREHLVVFLDGCFWHGCPAHGTTPKSNTDWWSAKIEKNRERDLRATSLLSDAGWTVLRFWEHEPTNEIVTRIEAELNDLRQERSHRDAPKHRPRPTVEPRV